MWFLSNELSWIQTVDDYGFSFRSATVSSCGKYLIVIPESGHQLLYFADLEKNGRINGKITLTPVVTKFEAEYDVKWKNHHIL